jgi:predicted DNA-binding WGR domain protein
VHEHVGGASFRCDLAIVNAAGDGYSLGILLDRDIDSGISVEERFLFRPTILRSFGWRVIDIPVAAWLRARDATVERIVAEICNDSWDQVDSDPYAGVTLATDVRAATPPQPVSALNPLSPVTAADAIVEPPLASEAVDANIPKMIEFRFVQGTSNKYWKVGVNGCDLIVEFGRVGTKGQRVIKTFDDEERAKREAIKLTLEKTRKGYEEFG